MISVKTLLDSAARQAETLEETLKQALTHTGHDILATRASERVRALHDRAFELAVLVRDAERRAAP